MPRILSCLVMIGLVIAGAHGFAQRRELRAKEPEIGHNGWLTSLDEGRSEAQKTGMPLMVVIRCQP
jgi:hypothetical protein